MKIRTSFITHYYSQHTEKVDGSTDCYSFEITFEDSSDWSAVLEVLNLLLRAINSSFEGGAGLSAIVGANNAGSLSFKDTCLVTMSTSSFLR